MPNELEQGGYWWTQENGTVALSRFHPKFGLQDSDIFTLSKNDLRSMSAKPSFNGCMAINATGEKCSQKGSRFIMIDGERVPVCYSHLRLHMSYSNISVEQANKRILHGP